MDDGRCPFLKVDGYLILQIPKACEQLTVVLDDVVSGHRGIGVNRQDRFDDLESEAGF